MRSNCQLCRLSLLCAIIFCSGLYAQIRISGTVRSVSDRPLADVEVRLQLQGLSTVTDSLGNYRLESASASGPRTFSSYSIPIISRNMLSFSVGEKRRVCVSAYTHGGRGVRMFEGVVSPGNRRIPLIFPRQAAGCFIVELTLGDDVYRFKHLHFGKSARHTGTNDVVFTPAGLGKKQSIVDTLVFSREGCVTLRFPIPEYAGTYDAVLEWILPSEISHPRILLFDGEDAEIASLIAVESDWAAFHNSMISHTNSSILGTSVVSMIGQTRSLPIARTALYRIFYCSYAYRMTGDTDYSDKAIAEMLAVAGFDDWYPNSDPIGMGEMTAAMAIGYDWCHAEISTEDAATISTAIYEKALWATYDPGFQYMYNNPVVSNWNSITNGGLILGCIAVYDVFPEIADSILEKSINYIRLALLEYNPDGIYPEAPTYWNYGTPYNAMALDAIEKIWPGKFDYTGLAGFLKSGEYGKWMVFPTKTGTAWNSFNYGHSPVAVRMRAPMYWYAKQVNKPSLLYVDKMFLEKGNYAHNDWQRWNPMNIIWGKETSLGSVGEPAEKIFTGGGVNPVAVIRSSWSDSDAIAIGIKAGDPDLNHNHMDVGSFILDSEGVRWASDLGPDGAAMAHFGSSASQYHQDANRWKIFRHNNYSHNTLTVDGELQRVSGYAQINEHGDAEDFPYVITNISSLYNTTLTSAKRGIGMAYNQYVVIRDEIKNNGTPSVVRWQMLTYAAVNITSNTEATLTSGDKSLKLTIDSPSGATLQTWNSETPRESWDTTNPGTTLIGFETTLAANQETTLQAILLPGSSPVTPSFVSPLNAWGSFGVSTLSAK